MHYSVSWSGGKDSTATIILAHEHNEPISSIVFAEVMYDKTNNISGENSEHMKFVYEVAKPLFESWGYKVYILRAKKDYLDVFHHVIKKPKKEISHKDKPYGFPMCTKGRCAIKRDCKMQPINDFCKSINEEVIHYVGIAIDEPQRLIALHKDKSQISLLEKYHMTEQDAKNLCLKYGLLSSSYKYTKRNGCWMCANAKMEEQKVLRSEKPDVWQHFLSLEKEDVAYTRWNSLSKETLAQREESIMWDERQLSMFDYIDAV